MPRRTEQEGPDNKLYVGARGTQEELRKHVDQYCRPLYGSGALVDHEGTIFVPQWQPVRKGERGYPQITSQEYRRLSKRRESEESYLTRDLHTLDLHELRIQEVKGEDGAGDVETAIRMSDHILANVMERELPQMDMAGRRIGELLDLFSDYSRVTIAQIEEAVAQTQQRLKEVNFNPDTVINNEKKRIGEWLPKASMGRDSLGRPNPLITLMALEAANRRVLWRRYGLGETTAKYVRIREALTFEREFSRSILEGAREKMAPPGPNSMQLHMLFQYPEAKAQNVGIVSGMLGHMGWELTQPRVKPYRPAGLEAGAMLGTITDLLQKDRRGEIMEPDLFGENLFDQTYGILNRVLTQYASIYPEE